ASMATATPTPASTRFGPALKVAGSILAESPLPRKEAILISDFQRSGWGRGGGCAAAGRHDVVTGEHRRPGRQAECDGHVRLSRAFDLLRSGTRHGDGGGGEPHGRTGYRRYAVA